MNDSLMCPQCNKQIKIPDALMHKFLDDAKISLREENKKNLEEALKESNEKHKEETAGLALKLQLKDEKLNESRDKELQLIKDKEKLEEEKRDLHIEIERRTSQKAKEIYDQTNKKFNEEQLRKEEEHKLELREKEELIKSLKEKNEEMTKKLSQGSQQLQGEVQELEIAEILRKLYPHDSIDEIKKGADGSDVKHTVKSPLGKSCGVILWESKRTKNWGGTWIEKLKTDLRREKADIPVLVTSILPKNVKTSVVFMDGVYICELAYVTFISNTLRQQILAVAKQKAISLNQESKSVKIYDYVTSNNHIQLLKHKFATFKRMKDQIDNERKVTEKLFKQREKQIEQLENADAEIYSTMAALLGSSMPQIEDFELESLVIKDNIKQLSDSVMSID